MKPDEVLADSIAVHVAQLSDLNIEGLSEAEEKEIRKDVGLLIGYATVSGIRHHKAALKGVAAVRKHLKEAQYEAGAFSELSLPGFQSPVEMIRKFQDDIRPVLRVVEDMARILEKKLPRPGGKDDAFLLMAEHAAEIYKRRTGSDPTMGNERPPDSGKYTSDYLNFLQGIANAISEAKPGGGEARGVKYAGDRAVKKWSKKNKDS